MLKAVLILLSVEAGSAVHAEPAQALPPQRDTGSEMTSARKRTELRNVLSAGRRAEPAAQIAPGEPVGHQLSQQERAEMREQLRRYQPPVAPRVLRP